jgi:hypothetical protein
MSRAIGAKAARKCCIDLTATVAERVGSMPCPSYGCGSGATIRCRADDEHKYRSPAKNIDWWRFNVIGADIVLIIVGRGCTAAAAR